MKPNEYLERLWTERASAILRTDDREAAREVMAAAVRGGINIVEFTLSVPGALELIEEFSAMDGVVAGAGTVLTAEQARESVRAGADFIVSPVLDEEVVAETLALGVVSMPGTHTATEMFEAYRMGAHLQKLFPPPAGAAEYVRSLLGPLPFLRVVPTSGVDGDNVGSWLDAGVFAVGFVRSLFPPDDVHGGYFDRIEARARRMVAAAREARRPDRSWSFE